MSKPRKVEDPVASYSAKPAKEDPPQPVKFVTLDAVKKSNAELLKIHRKVLQKLAQ